MDKILLIPYPKDVTVYGGWLDCRRFRLYGEECFASKDFENYAKKIGEENEEGTGIFFFIDPELALDSEGYVLDITDSGVSIKASAESGIRYAFCSLRQLYHHYCGVLPLCHIKDEPYLKHRGLLMDNGRHFFPKSDVLKMLDLCYMHKLNVFHWHLTEDQGWRIAIDKYPLLTEKGSKRSHTNFGLRPHGGFYTKEDVREVIAYANERGIEVIPEIDMPGHMQAALACYPELGCFGRKLKVSTHSGIKHDVLCAGKESTYRFVFGVLEEIVELFGENTKYIHIGGDEVVHHRWRLCGHCQALMEREGLKDEHELQAYFMRRVADWLTDRGFIPIAWNGIKTETVVNGNLVLQYWCRDYGGENTLEYKQAMQYGGFITSTSKYAYMDLPYGKISLKRSYEFNPLPENYPEEKLLGSEIALWTEYVPDFKTGSKRLLPRSLALAEAMWRKGDKDRYKEFLTRLYPALRYLKQEGFFVSPMRTVNPGKFRGFLQTLWFEKRQLHLEGLHYLIDDAYISAKYRKKK